MTEKLPDPASAPVKPAPGLTGGLLAVWRGAGFIFRNRSLLPLALFPVIINTILYTVFLAVSLKYFYGWLTGLLPQSEAWYWAVLLYVLMILFGAALILAVVFTFTAVANILASPFNDALSAKTEELATGRQDDRSFSLAAVIKEAGRTVVEELKKIAFYLAAIAVLLLVNMVPLVGPVLYSVLFGLLTILWLALSFLDYSFARHEMRLKDKLGFIKKSFRPSFGYGLGLTVSLAIPFFNLIALPAAVVGGTLLYVELGKSKT